jgi:hypothetical protein
MANSNPTHVNIQVLPVGFGSYLNGILPPDVATACGAFSVSMRQVKKIKNVPVEKFAQVVANLETTKNLDLIGGTDIPVDTSLVSSAVDLIALGSGPNGTYTVSDFFGCMSGLPYAWSDIQNLITQIQTTSLSTIYGSLYTTIAAGPISSDPGDITAYNNAIQSLISNAEAEILNIYNSNIAAATLLNTLYDYAGTQLTIEQTARNTALSPVPYPGRDPNLSQYPTTIYSFVDTIPIYAEDTAPHMTAQTIEAIADWNTVGGQSIIGMLRQARNEARLSKAGIPLDNTISDELPESTTDALIANGTAPTTSNVGVTTSLGQFTFPSIPSLEAPPSPSGFFDPNIGYQVSASVTNTTSLGQLLNAVTPPVPQAGPVVVLGPGSPLDAGQADEPGSFAGSSYKNLIPPNLDTAFTSKVLSPAVLSVPEAIDQVITCNCDCWVN